MIYCICRTNLNECRWEEWPTDFPVIPQKGDWVQAKGGCQLKVVGIVYKSEYVEIELNK